MLSRVAWGWDQVSVKGTKVHPHDHQGLGPAVATNLEACYCLKYHCIPKPGPTGIIPDFFFKALIILNLLKFQILLYIKEPLWSCTKTVMFAFGISLRPNKRVDSISFPIWKIHCVHACWLATFHRWFLMLSRSNISDTSGQFDPWIPQVNVYH